MHIHMTLGQTWILSLCSLHCVLASGHKLVGHKLVSPKLTQRKHLLVNPPIHKPDVCTCTHTYAYTYVRIAKLVA